MLNSELQETLKNTEEIQLTKLKINEIKNNQTKVKDELKQAYEYKSRARTNFLSGVLQATGSIVGSVIMPVFGGVLGYGATSNLNLKEKIDEKVQKNLQKID